MIDSGANAPERLRTDTCIVGSGPAGMTVALELARRGVECVLLESGGRTPDAGHAALNETAQIGIRTDVGNRVRALGGTSAVWGGLCRRLNPLDFERRPWVPDSGWPIGLGDLLPHYDTAHRILGLPPAEYEPARIDPARGSDVPLRGRDFHNVVFYYNGRPMRFGQHYAPQLESSSRIRTWLDSTVVDVATDEAGRRVTGLEVATLGGRRFRVEASRFVLACGAVQNARLLLHASRERPQGLGNGEGLVGRYFLQHPVWYKPRLLAFGEETTKRVRRSDNAQVVLTTALQAASARRHGLLSFHFMAKPPRPAPGFDRPRQLLRYWRGQLEASFEEPTPEEATGTWLAELEDALAPGSARHPVPAGIEIRPEQAPNPSSRIALGSERDALGVPLATMDWRLSSLDRESLERGARLLARSMALSQIGRLQASPEQLHVPEPEGEWLHGGNHHYGTTRMSDSPRQGVVDRSCRVHGLENLYVAGSSVFPTTGYANPTLTIVALAARLAEHLAGSGPSA